MLFHILRLSDIEEVFLRASVLLDRDVKVVGSRAGWHQFIGEQKVGDVATAQGILILSYLNRSHRLLRQFLNTLKGDQFRDDNDPNCGGWSFLSSRDIPTLEPTAWSLLGLLAGGEPSDSVTIILGKEWIKNNQNPDGGWGPRKGLASRVYTTYLASRCLSILEPHLVRENTQHFRDAIRWIVSCQRADGGWGATAEATESTAIHTAFALLALHALGVDRRVMEIEKGIQYLFATWNSETMWEHTPKFEQYEIPKDNESWTRITFHYFPTPWVLTALLVVGETVFEEQIFSSIKWLIRSQNIDGTWSIDGVHRSRLWAIHDAILALTTFLDKIVSTHTIERVVLLDGILVLTRGKNGKGLARLAFFCVAGLLLVGAVIGAILGSGTGLHAYIGPWVQRYWAWALLGIYIASAFPLARFKIISWKEALIGVLLPALLVLIQIYLKP